MSWHLEGNYATIWPLGQAYRGCCQLGMHMHMWDLGNNNSSLARLSSAISYQASASPRNTLSSAVEVHLGIAHLPESGSNRGGGVSLSPRNARKRYCHLPVVGGLRFREGQAPSPAPVAWVLNTYRTVQTLDVAVLFFDTTDIIVDSSLAWQS
jgi:hypothetical protein